jgi:hypothetical protein
MRRRSLWTWVTVCLTIMLAGSCTRDSSDTVTTTAGTAQDNPSSPPPTYVKVPPAQLKGAGSSGSGSQFQLGNRIFITASGFEPSHLLAGIDYKITFVNASSAPQGIRFVNFGNEIQSGDIPPGEGWVYEPKTAGSIIYSLTSPPYFKGYLQIQLVQKVG